MAMTIEELKKALVEVSELCAHTKCVACPLHYVEISGIPECPLSDEALMMPPERGRMEDEISTECGVMCYLAENGLEE